MNRIEQLLKRDYLGGPIESLDMMHAVLGSLYGHVNAVIPDSAILVGGSAAFYFQFQDRAHGKIAMNDLDISLVHNRDLILELHEETKAFNQLKVIRDTCTIVPMGVGDLHIDTDTIQTLRHFRSGTAGLNKNIRFMSRQNLVKFYQKMNRPKDQEKLRIMAA